MTPEHKCYASRTNEAGQHVCDICKNPINTMKEVRIQIIEGDVSYSFPINCPSWLLWVLHKLEI